MAKKPQSHGMATTRTSGMLPEGTYRFKVLEAEERDGPQGLYWNFTVECLSKPFNGNRSWVAISHSPQARFKADEWLDAFAIPEDDEAFMEDFVGQTFRGTVEHKESQGKMRANIVSFLPDAKGSVSGKTVSAPSKPSKPKVKYQEEEDEDDAETEEEEEEEEESDDEDTDEEDIDEEEEEADDEEDVEEEEEEDDEEDVPIKSSKKSTPKHPAKSSKPAPKGKLPADVKPKPKYRKPF